MICLNMIVRNEGRIIRRLLDSVKEVVDEYVIVDTGSTDDTVQQIQMHTLPGTVLHEPFVNFGVSRTKALEQARHHSRCEYILLLDADMELQCPNPVPPLTADAYYVTQRGGFTYLNIRLVRRTLPVTCVGATHEFYQLPPMASIETLPEDVMLVLDHGDGGSKSDKFERDERLLREALQQDPNNPRTVFYLAQTMMDVGKHRDAINMYQRRIALQGWDQEVTYSEFRIAKAYALLGNWDLAKTWTDLAQASGRRAEPAYYLCKAFRQAGHHLAAYHYLLQARQFTKPSPQDCLFIDNAVYDYLLDFEQTVLWSYVHPCPLLLPVGMDLSLRFLEKSGVPEDIRQCVLDNTVYYVTPLTVHPQVRGPPRRLFPDEFFTETPWRYSSAGYLDDGTLYTRLVNYRYTDDGTTFMTTVPEDLVRTRLLVGSRVIDDIRNETSYHDPSASILGLEDTRIVRHDGCLYTLSASTEYARFPGLISQVLGKLDVDRGIHTLVAVLDSPLQKPWEKNWVVAGSLDRVIYRWYPSIWVGRIDVASQTLVHTHSIPSPPSFLGMRGSTNGVFYDNLWWFVTHTTIYDRGPVRKYMHRLVAMDKDLCHVEFASSPFVFEPVADVEYCLGFRVLPDGTATFAYSVRDRLPRELQIPLYAM
jgi:glycosyltransferase involved in cell wall biosynthesis